MPSHMEGRALTGDLTQPGVSPPLHPVSLDILHLKGGWVVLTLMTAMGAHSQCSLASSRNGELESNLGRCQWHPSKKVTELRSREWPSGGAKLQVVSGCPIDGDTPAEPPGTWGHKQDNVAVPSLCVGSLHRLPLFR